MNNWISVEDELPSKSGEYLVYTKERPSFLSYCGIGVVNYNDPSDSSLRNATRGWVYYGMQVNPIDRAVTHWQPLPAPPKESPND